jgi:hypothetical protein
LSVRPETNTHLSGTATNPAPPKNAATPGAEPSVPKEKKAQSTGEVATH